MSGSRRADHYGVEDIEDRAAGTVEIDTELALTSRIPKVLL